MSKKKIIFLSLAVVVIAVFVFLNLRSDAGNTTTVNATAASETDIIEIVSASGRIQPQSKVNITSEVNGEIVKLLVREGQEVRQGDLLIVLDTVRLRSDVDQARFAVSEINARLEGSKTSLDQAQEEFDRQQKMRDQNLTSETQYKDAKYQFLSMKSSYDAMLAQSRQMNSAFEKQVENFSKAKIVAPMNGIVTFVDVEEGEIAAAQTAFTQGKTLMTISNLNVFEVEVEVDETEVNKVSVGQSARIEVDAFPDTTFPGSVIEIGNTAVVQGQGTQDLSTNFKVKVIFNDSDVAIRPGMSATVDITTKKRDMALALPFSSVVVRSFDMDSLLAARASTKEDGVVNAVHAAETTKGDKAGKSGKDIKRKELKGVFVIKDGVARFTEIETGISDSKNIEVSSGVQVGDSVVSGPYSVLRTLKDGDKVEPEKDDEENGKSEE
ncbi:MAG: efflux RND transporter periplasmic adaptor subunit [candidate division Zixibacteria bacterium]|nr:efflux RND transporter periplasmic adaptor subunit [candidate division Zixibacteria bacterium]